ncbi:uncharacterized protein LOC125590370 [Brassica napus]|uniref:uncharacterized protein LOC125590370 n=1 Tax=Brassica napus TaxID=3708 RepID=UPI0020796774|nr:uncharacterized protein LOC125590370 [Brassica napus]
MCNVFLWNGARNSAMGAKIAWDSVCTPKEAGGLGLKRLEDWNKVLGLKLIWLIFTSGGSLWVSSSFWHDNWTSLGPLIELVRERRPQVSGLRREAVVAEALTSDGWWLARSRSRSPTIALLKACLPNAQEIMESEEDDMYIWFPEPGRDIGVFSASDTWRAMHPSPIEVFWHEVVWFTGRIPKNVSLLGLQLETECNQVWAFFVSRLNLVSPQSFKAVLRWLKAPTRNKNVTLIIRLIHQAVLCLVWKERNKRIHTAVEKPPGTLIAETQQIVKLRLDPPTRRQITPQGQDLVLATWFSFFAG